jgi:hypothetical protein
MQERAVVGHQQQSGGIAVEPADARQHRVAQAEARRQQVVHQAPDVLGRAGVTDRLVQHQQHARRRIQRLVVEADVLVRGDIVRTQFAPVGVRDPAVAQHRGDVLAAAVAKVGEVLDEFHARRASITLNPSWSASMRTLAKACASAAS